MRAKTWAAAALTAALAAGCAASVDTETCKALSDHHPNERSITMQSECEYHHLNERLDRIEQLLQEGGS